MKKLKEHYSLFIFLIIILCTSGCIPDKAMPWAFVLTENLDSVKQPLFKYDGETYALLKVFNSDSLKSFIKSKDITSVTVIDADNKEIECDSVNLSGRNITLYRSELNPVTLDVYELKEIEFEWKPPRERRLNRAMEGAANITGLALLFAIISKPFSFKTLFVGAGVGVLAGSTSYIIERTDVKVISSRYIKPDY